MRKKLLCLLLAISTLSLSYAHSGENFIVSDIFTSVEASDKVAILMVHFGTSYDDTRAITIDALNQRVREIYKGVELREAYTSRIVTKILKKRGIEKLNPTESLKQLHAEGYTHVLVQSSHVIEGVEMKLLREEVKAQTSLFKDIRIGDPLLYSVNDYEKVIKALCLTNNPEKSHLLIGHGTYDPSTSQYAMLDYMLKNKGFPNYYVATLEGYPSLDIVKKELQDKHFKQITLHPFLFVAGDHAQNDIAEDCKKEFEDLGFQVNVHMKGLGEYPAIQAIFLSHLDFIAKHKKIELQDKKKQLENN